MTDRYVKFKFTPPAWEWLQKIQPALGCKSPAEVVGKALSLLKAVDNAQQAGDFVQFQRPDKKTYATLACLRRSPTDRTEPAHVVHQDAEI